MCKPSASCGCGSLGSGLGTVVLVAALAAVLSAAAALIEDILTAALVTLAVLAVAGVVALVRVLRHGPALRGPVAPVPPVRLIAAWPPAAISAPRLRAIEAPAEGKSETWLRISNRVVPPCQPGGHSRRRGDGR